MLINVTIQTFMSENELELSDKRWTDIKDEYLPTLYELGLKGTLPRAFGISLTSTN